MVQLRRARPDEFQRFADWEIDEAVSPFVNHDTAEDHAARAAQAAATYFAIEREGLIDGFVILMLDPDGRSVEVRRVVVATRDLGTGQAALAEVLRYCRDVLNRRRVWLDVNIHNARAQHVYKKLGFEFCEPPTGQTNPEEHFMDLDL